MKILIIMRSLIAFVTVLAFSACTSAPKNELSSSANPREEIDRLSGDLGFAQKLNVDVLARKDYLRAYSFLEEARGHLAKGKDQEVVIDDLRYGREALKLARLKAETRTNKAPSLFEARQKAIRAGGARLAAHQREWIDIDEDIASRSDEIDKISPEDLDLFQGRYVEMERKAVVESQVGKANAQFEGARSDGAKKSAPLALRKAEMSLKNAESLIGSNLNKSSEFDQAVRQANNDALFLAEVVEVIKQNGKSLTEAAASKLVLQRREITDLKRDLSLSEGAIAGAESMVNRTNQSLVDKEKSLGEARASIAIQKALEEARQKFSPDEAETYQQGGSLLIRLKSMNFQSGHAELPTQSMLLLARVSEVAMSLGAKEIRVEGHTDSVGRSEANKKLSEQRAVAVATYFKANGFAGKKVLSEGHGFEKPIATNKSKVGRAQNRRVDIIITPVSDNSTQM